MNEKYKLHEWEDICTYLFNEEKRLLYISCDFQDLRDIENCDDYFVVDMDKYEEEDDIIKELIDKVLNEEE